MILSAYHINFTPDKMGSLPGPVDLKQKPQKLNKYQKMHQEMGPLPPRPLERGVRGAAAPQEEKKRGRMDENTKISRVPYETQDISHYAPAQ